MASLNVLIVSNPTASADDPDACAHRFASALESLSPLLVNREDLDLVALIGDLTQSASAADFEVLNEHLQELLLNCMIAGSSEPYVIAVPGDKDGAGSADRGILSLALTQNWREHETSFWEGTDPDLLRLVADRYSTFSAWHGPQRRPNNWQAGLIPGNGSCKIEKNDLSLRIVTLNDVFRLVNAAARSQPSNSAISLPQLADTGLEIHSAESASTLVLCAQTATFPPSSIGTTAVLFAGTRGASVPTGWNVLGNRPAHLLVRLNSVPGGNPQFLADGGRQLIVGSVASAPSPTIEAETPSTDIDYRPAWTAFSRAIRSGRTVLVITSGLEALSTNEWGVAVSNVDDLHEMLAEHAGAHVDVPLTEIITRMRRENPTTLRHSVTALMAVSDPKNALAEGLIRGPWYRVYDFTGTNISRLAAEALNVGAHRIDVVDARLETVTPGSGKLEVVLMSGGAAQGERYEIDFDFDREVRSTRNLWLRQFRADLITNPTLFTAWSVSSRHLQNLLKFLPPVDDGGRNRQPSFLIAQGSDKSAEYRQAGFGVQRLPTSIAELIDKQLRPGIEIFEVGARTLMRQRAGLQQGTGVQLVGALLENAGAGDSKFLRGTDPTWGDILSGIPARLSTVQKMHDAVRERQGETYPIMLLEDRSGTGKSTALMQFGKELLDQGLLVGWLDRDTTRRVVDVGREIANFNFDAILVDDIDIFGDSANSLLRQLNQAGETLVVATVRTTRARLISAQFARIEPLKLTEGDLDGLVRSLDVNRELGRLKRHLLHESRVDALRRVSGQDLMFAMNEAIYGYRLERRVISEYDQLGLDQKRIYAFVCLFYAVQYKDRAWTLSENELVQIVSTGRPDARIHNLISELQNQRLLVRTEVGQIRSRHRIVAERIYVERIRADHGFLRELLTELILFYVEMAWNIRDNSNRYRRVMIRLINHRIMVQSGLSSTIVRAIYHELHDWLRDDFHYWLQCGSYELEKGDLDLAATYLQSAMGCTNGATDHLVLTTWGLIAFRQARRHPGNREIQEDALAAFHAMDKIVKTVGARSPHTFAFIAGDGVEWLSRTPLLEPSQKQGVARRIREIIDIGDRILDDNPEFEAAVGRSRSVLVELLEPVESQPEKTIPL